MTHYFITQSIVHMPNFGGTTLRMAMTLYRTQSMLLSVMEAFKRYNACQLNFQSRRFLTRK